MKKKSTAFILWLFGFHYAYFGKWGRLILYWITAGGFFVWMFADLFRLGSMVDNHNLREELRRLRK